jgi:hypothetical protein
MGWRQDAVDRLEELIRVDVDKKIDRTPLPYWRNREVTLSVRKVSPPKQEE